MNIGLHKITDSKPFVPARVTLALPRHWLEIDKIAKGSHKISAVFKMGKKSEERH